MRSQHAAFESQGPVVYSVRLPSGAIAALTPTADAGTSKAPRPPGELRTVDSRT